MELVKLPAKIVLREVPSLIVDFVLEASSNLIDLVSCASSRA